jgi:diguanylate cyclase (GGDEF)-like protein/PAS domain S-box-containing protein
MPPDTRSVSLSLRWRVALLVALSVATVAGALVLVHERSLRAQLLAARVDAVGSVAEQLEDHLAESPRAPWSPAASNDLREEITQMVEAVGANRLVVTGLGGAILAHSDSPRLIGTPDPIAAVKRRVIASGRPLTVEDEAQGRNGYSIVVPLDAPGIGRVALEVQVDASELEAAVVEARRTALLPGIFVLVVAVLLAMRLTTRYVAHARSREQGVEARFRSLLQHSSEVIAVHDSTGTVSYLTPSVHHVMGFEPSELVGRGWFEVIHPDDVAALRECFAEVLRQDEALSALELRLRNKDESWRWVDASVVNLMADPNVGGIVANYRDLSERKGLEEQLAHSAFHDPLTNLANRVLFRDRITNALAHRDRNPQPLAVMFLDLDDFKVVNDSLGHAAGDRLLVAVGRRLQENLRPSDTAARLGGDEFAVLIDDVVNPDDALLVAQRVIEVMRAPFWLDGRQFLLHASMGIAISSSGEEEADQLLRNADVAMYRAKSRGTGHYEVYERDMHAAIVERLELKEELERALEDEEFSVFYQPIVVLSQRRIVGVEALVRWHHPERGVVMPAAFISLAEETGLIVPIGRWVLQEACRQTRSWQLRYPGDPPLSVAVNLSPRQFEQPELTEEVANALRESGLAPGDLTLEITENLLMENTETTMLRLKELKKLGVRLAIDDFGTGYSSLGYLQRFPVDRLKLDKSFVDGVVHSGDDAALARAVVQLGDTLGLQTVAEGIELGDQVDELINIGCELGQGYYFSKPLSAQEIESILGRTVTAASPRGLELRHLQ